jgi:hypothetical protein
MTSEALRNLCDLLLPGDESGLPPGSRVPEVMRSLLGSLSPIKSLALAHPDLADADKRLMLFISIEQEHPQAFRDFVLSLIKPYYESAEVLAAMGWRSAPPQPQGHAVAPMDKTLTADLAKMVERGRRWR